MFFAATAKRNSGKVAAFSVMAGPAAVDAICHAAPARCWVHPNRDPAFNPPAKARKPHSAFCSEEEGIPTSNGLFQSEPSLSYAFFGQARRIWANIAKLPELSAPNVTRPSFDVRLWGKADM